MTTTRPPSAYDPTTFVELVYYDVSEKVDLWTSVSDYILRTGFQNVQIRHVPAPHQNHDQWFAAYLHLEEDVIVKIQGPLPRYPEILDQADWYVALGRLRNDATPRDGSIQKQISPNQRFERLGSHRGQQQYVAVYIGLDEELLVKVQGPTHSYDKIEAYADWYQSLGRLDLKSIKII